MFKPERPNSELVGFYPEVVIPCPERAANTLDGLIYVF